MAARFLGCREKGVVVNRCAVYTFLARSVLSNISFRVVSPTRLMRGAAACTGLSTGIGGAGGTPAGAGGSAEDIYVKIYQNRTQESRRHHNGAFRPEKR